MLAGSFPPSTSGFRGAAGSRSGWRKETGFVVRALDEAGVVFENNSSNTLAEAMAALEEGLAGRFRDQQAALRSSSPKVEKRQRRRHDA